MYNQVGPECTERITFPHESRFLKAGEIMAELIAIGATPIKIDLDAAWEPSQSPFHITTVECTMMENQAAPDDYIREGNGHR